MKKEIILSYVLSVFCFFSLHSQGNSDSGANEPPSRFNDLKGPLETRGKHYRQELQSYAWITDYGEVVRGKKVFWGKAPEEVLRESRKQELELYQKEFKDTSVFLDRALSRDDYYINPATGQVCRNATVVDKIASSVPTVVERDPQAAEARYQKQLAEWKAEMAKRAKEAIARGKNPPMDSDPPRRYPKKVAVPKRVRACGDSSSAADAQKNREEESSARWITENKFDISDRDIDRLFDMEDLALIRSGKKTKKQDARDKATAEAERQNEMRKRGERDDEYPRVPFIDDDDDSDPMTRPNRPGTETGTPTNRPGTGTPTNRPGTGNPTNRPGTGNPSNRPSAGNN